MYYTPDQVLNGIINFADSEIMGMLPITGRWIAGTAIGLATSKVNNIISALQENKILNMLELFDENGNIDVDSLIIAMKSAADKYGKMTVDVPMIGKLSFSSADVDRLRSYIV